MLKVVWSSHDTLSEVLGLLPALCIRSEFPYSQRKLSIGWKKEKVPFTLTVIFSQLAWLNRGEAWAHIVTITATRKQCSSNLNRCTCLNDLHLGHSAHTHQSNWKGSCLKTLCSCSILQLLKVAGKWKMWSSPRALKARNKVKHYLTNGLRLFEDFRNVRLLFSHTTYLHCLRQLCCPNTG